MRGCSDPRPCHYPHHRPRGGQCSLLAVAQSDFVTLLELTFFPPSVENFLKRGTRSHCRSPWERGQRAWMPWYQRTSLTPFPLFCPTAWVGSRWLQWLGISAPGGAAPTSAAPRLGRESGQPGPHLLRQPQQSDHAVAPTQPNVSAIRGREHVPHSAHRCPHVAALRDRAGKHVFHQWKRVVVRCNGNPLGVVRGHGNLTEFVGYKDALASVSWSPAVNMH